jgi:hypothetical protein
VAHPTGCRDEIIAWGEPPVEALESADIPPVVGTPSVSTVPSSSVSSGSRPLSSASRSAVVPTLAAIPREGLPPPHLVDVLGRARTGPRPRPRARLLQRGRRLGGGWNLNRVAQADVGILCEAVVGSERARSEVVGRGDRSQRLAGRHGVRHRARRRSRQAD